jgi:gluconolactonase
MMFDKIKILLFSSLLVMSCTSQKLVKSQSIVNNGAEIQLVSNQFSFTEGPASDRFGNVYFTDQPNDKIYFWDWKTNKIEEFRTKQEEQTELF